MLVRRITRAKPDGAPIERESQCPDRDLLAVLFFFWMISLARVLVGVARTETFGTEGTLALLAVLLGPWLMKDVATRWFARRTTSRSSRAKGGASPPPDSHLP
jgi:hypothetical protein